MKKIDDERYFITNQFGETIPILLGITEAAELMGDNWDRRKLSVYFGRGKFIDPSIIIGSRPFWTLQRVEEFQAKTISGEDE